MRSAPQRPKSTLSPSRTCRNGGLALATFLLPLWMHASARAADCPMFGYTPARNMVSSETHLPTSADAGKPKGDSDIIDPSTTKNVKWSVKLGNNAYGNVTIAGGRVFAATNNDHPRDPRYTGDRGVLLCLDETSGKLNWQLSIPKLSAGQTVDRAEVGLCSSPTVDGERVYLVTPRCEVLCLDVAGMANGNDGDFKDEAQYTAGPGKPPIPSTPADADIIWRYDMRSELGVFPHLMTASSVLVVGDRLYVTTSNGVDWTEKHVPSPWAPALICLDKHTGKLLGREQSGIGARPLFGSWSSPAFGTVGGKPTLVFGGGDGVCYGFDPEPVPGGPDGAGMLKEIWRVDANAPAQRMKDGKPSTVRDKHGPSEIVGVPVIANDCVYIATGQVSESGLEKGAGCLTCIGAAGGKIDALWRDAKIGMTMSTASVGDGLVYIADATGYVHCRDAKTGAVVWDHDTESEIWGSTLLADGKVYIGNESGELQIVAAGREKKFIGKIDLQNAIYSTPVAANGALYVSTTSYLYALQEKSK